MGTWPSGTAGVAGGGPPAGRGPGGTALWGKQPGAWAGNPRTKAGAAGLTGCGDCSGAGLAGATGAAASSHLLALLTRSLAAAGLAGEGEQDESAEVPAPPASCLDPPPAAAATAGAVRPSLLPFSISLSCLSRSSLFSFSSPLFSFSLRTWGVLDLRLPSLRLALALFLFSWTRLPRDRRPCRRRDRSSGPRCRRCRSSGPRCRRCLHSARAGLGEQLPPQEAPKEPQP
mmetsp:Transcript_110379/g.330117  ORF Transcript_110379/g.330117 Transcript_110379/m.330117 type:complete len:230 (-) Transcript_110379:110-799(-)